MQKQPAVYILTNKSNNVLYVGVTSDLIKRIYEHKNHVMEGFTAKYNVTKLVYFELCDEMETAITREKVLKGWKRSKKVSLIEKENATWQDLYEDLI
ncbi:GIY-YIG nuclease family protein [Sulfurimonas xiamenensis]|uniref:GIY-YIG nuclease family protein n=1 Tax=Sulfurimonas xiamenensis TaxID=2590021 RepID=A0AAJ4A286_9BACT|nr:GIY-YIG nuclease family protein [Sulfurimonas xiamenensis]PLY14344.1 MAG: endonuclease [Sulfurimonas sp.]QFR42543.1 GIY-YIG nuclease family protein [Sulfurimonas xiamenensis]